MTQPIYDPNIPQFTSDGLATTQSQFQANFKSLFNIFNENHVSIISASSPGNHTIVELLEQKTTPQTSIAELSLYTKDAPGQTDQVYIRKENNAVEYQYTNYQVYQVGANTFFTILPGRIIQYFGTLPSEAGGKLNLRPAIATKIAAVSYCPKGSTPLQKTSFVIVDAQDGFFKQILFPNYDLNYLVIANI